MRVTCPLSRRRRRSNETQPQENDQQSERDASLDEFQDCNMCEAGCEAEVDTAGSQDEHASPSTATATNDDDGAKCEPSVCPTITCEAIKAEIAQLTLNIRHCLPGEADKEAHLYISRSNAHLNLSRHLRSIPASTCEQRAIYAPDPEALALKALTDADNALKLLQPRYARGLSARADALFLLERYPEARDAYCAVHQLTPDDILTGRQLAKCNELLLGGGGPASAQRRPEQACLIASGSCAENPVVPQEHPCAEAQERLLQDLECTLCLKLLYEPVTTPCGHTFCQPCYARASDHTNKCPMCRTVLHVGRKLPVSIVLKTMLERMFPTDYATRREEETVAAGMAASDDSTPLALFVMNVILPGERMALNIFEPRYRLMIRRVMEGSRRFGMAVVDRSHALANAATEVEILECEPQPDGRFLVEIIGRRRFQPTQSTEQDGYRVTVPQFFRDEVVECGSDEAGELESVSLEVEQMADSWTERLRSLGQSRGACLELLRRAGEKPPRSDYERFSFWVGNLICPVIDESSLKFRLLATKSSLERVKLLRHVLQQVRDVQICSGCCVM